MRTTNKNVGASAILLALGILLLAPSEESFASSKTSSSPNTILVAESKPLTVLYALESVLKLPMRSPSIAERICDTKSLPAETSKEEAAQINVRCATARALGKKAFATVARSVAFWPGSTTHSTGYQGGWNIEEVLEVAAVQSTSIQNFIERAAPLFPAPALINLKAALEQLEPLVQTRLLNKRSPFQRRAKEVLLNAISERRLHEFLSKTGELIGSEWPADLPITVALVPVPISRGSGTPTYAHRSGPLVIIEVLEDDNLEHRLGVIAHELVHVLWFARPLARVEQLAAAFRASSPTFGRIALTLLSEGIATALGNGLFVTQNTQKIPSGEWYADPNIDRFAKLLYPMLKERMQNFSPIDETFAKDVVEIFGARAPDAIFSPQLNFRHTIVIADALFTGDEMLSERIRTNLGSERVQVLKGIKAEIGREIVAHLGDYGTLLIAPPDNISILEPFVRQEQLNQLIGTKKRLKTPEVVTCRTSRGKWYAIILARSVQELEAGLHKLARAPKIPLCGRIH